ncbi:DUF2202 domain-containing protein [Pontiellaceae bacterium B12219]|nr:DUF2202 domain-containing protein [Pontiellaceae bacterium B12219]
MKYRTALALMLFGIATSVMLESAFAGKGKGNNNPTPVTILTQQEADGLLFMREEEKLARDVYITLYAEWGNRVFDTISQAEQKHMDSMLGLLNTYGLADPVLEFGYFADQDLQALFDSLVTTGLQSQLDALMVGALIEEVDIEDIVDAMDRTDKTDILNVYGRLLAGSENHLNAFVRNIESITGETYVAQWISQEEVDEILGR